MKSVLNERQLAILRMHFVDSMTQEEIAENIGLTQARVCQLIGEAFDKIRDTKNIILEFDL